MDVGDHFCVSTYYDIRSEMYVSMFSQPLSVKRVQALSCLDCGVSSCASGLNIDIF